MATFDTWLTSTLGSERVAVLSAGEKIQFRVQYDEAAYNQRRRVKFSKLLGFSADQKTLAYLINEYSYEYAAILNEESKENAISLCRKCGSRLHVLSSTAVIPELPGVILAKESIGALRSAYEPVSGMLVPKLVKQIEATRELDRIQNFPVHGFCHPNIVQHRFVSVHLRHYMIMEYCPTTLSALPKLRADGTGPQTVGSIITQVLSGLDYLHSLGFVHFDVKAENIGVTQDGRLVLIDLCSVERFNALSYETTDQYVPKDMPGRVAAQGLYAATRQHDLYMLAAMLLNLCGILRKSFSRADIRMDFGRAFGKVPEGVLLLLRLEDESIAMPMQNESSIKLPSISNK